MAIRTNGVDDDPTKEALVQVGSEDHFADNVTMDSTVAALYNGKVKIYGKHIDIAVSERGIVSMNGGQITLSAGTGETEGLSLKGSGTDANSFGMVAWSKENSVIDVISGNVYIDKFKNAVWAGNAGTNTYGTVNLGSADAPLPEVQISNASKGLFSSTKGTIRVHAENLTIADEVGTPVTAFQGTVAVHTSGMATLKGTNRYSLSNSNGTIAINSASMDGSTRLTGGVYTKGDQATTDLGFHTAQSLFYGDVFDVHEGKTTVSVSNGGVWNLDDTLDKEYNRLVTRLNLATGGTVNLSVNGHESVLANGYATMQVIDFAGEGGTLVFRTDLQGSTDAKQVTGHGDLLHIMGTSAGSHDILINDHSKVSNLTAYGGYVLLVRDESAAPGAVFTGNVELQNGGLFARKVEVTNEDPDAALGYTDVPEGGKNWYVRMTDESYEPELTANAEDNTAFALARYGALWLEEDTLRKRLGDLRGNKQDDGIWAQIKRGEYRMDGLDGTADYTMYLLGYDKELRRTEGKRRFAGVAYHHTDVDLNHRNFDRGSGMDADIGTVYYTNLYDKGHYLDLVGKWGRMKGSMNTSGEFPEEARWRSNFFSLSAEYGRKITCDDGRYWEPQAQLTYGRLSTANYITTQGTRARLNALNSLIFRAGFTLGKRFGEHEENDLYASLFWHHEFRGNVTAHFEDKNEQELDVSRDFGGSWFTAGIGGQRHLGDDVYIYGDLERSFGGAVTKKWEWHAGIRYAF
ncbi:MAG: autotransporter outer membrane beta-barrel domain-containing protein [Veillonellaceae bacterium]|nr:autotransporter outer membrane beta-barrel domain-containing protein [Veillonellaceae bacterium]